MQNELNITDELLVKYLLGEASETEMQQVQLWINNSTDNKKYYSELEQVWNKSKDIAAKSVVSTDEAWERFKTRTQKKRIPLTSYRRYNWLKIAALVLFFIGSGKYLFLSRQNSPVVEKTASIPHHIDKIITLDNDKEVIKNEPVKEEYPVENTNSKKQITAVNLPKKKVKINEYKKNTVFDNQKTEGIPNRTKGVICNGTPCPIEICITQTIKCHGQPSTISTCSTLEPDQSGRLHYKTHDKIGRHCTMSVDEITIKTISTGETIVLNANSKPATAQDFFQYITGQKKGGILAGVFHDDCNDDHDCGLRFDNNFGGDLILQ